jgi:hypothetical protein
MICLSLIFLVCTFTIYSSQSRVCILRTTPPSTAPSLSIFFNNIYLHYCPSRSQPTSAVVHYYYTVSVRISFANDVALSAPVGAK